VEYALFDQTGQSLAGIDASGGRHVWDVATGRLLGSDPGGEEEHPIVWSADRQRGAVCHRGMLEIVNATEEYEDRVDVDYPYGATWDGSGALLAYAAPRERAVFVIRAARPRARPEVYECGDGLYPVGLALSPDGRFLAYGRDLDRPTWGFRVPHFSAVPSRGASWMQLGVAVVDRATRRRRVVLEHHELPVRTVRFISPTRILAADSGGQVIFLDVTTGDVLARWWANSRVVGARCDADRALVADSGEGSLHHPVVYALTLR
jgi:hypothetical protein